MDSQSTDSSELTTCTWSLMLIEPWMLCNGWLPWGRGSWEIRIFSVFSTSAHVLITYLMLFHSSVFSFFPVTAVQKILTLFEACISENIHFSIDSEKDYVLRKKETSSFSCLTQTYCSEHFNLFLLITLNILIYQFKIKIT